MTIKNILCAYSGEAARGSGVRQALRVAKHHDAWITGVLRHGRPLLQRQFSVHLPPGILQQLRASDQEHITRVAAQFHSLAEEAGMADRVTFVDIDLDKDGMLYEYARPFDMIITGAHSTDSSEEHMSASPDLLALRSGRPVLIVPNGYEAATLADHALVAWDGNRSAARALGDALSILKEKPKVTIMTVGDAAGSDRDVLIQNLERHGISADYILRPKKGRISDTLINAAEELSAQLIVMGAFEHSKFSRAITGGVTSDVIADATVPVFLSH